MSTKISVGLTKKAGLPDYGSVGASCHVEFELDNASPEESEAFQARVRQAYAACSRAVNDELQRQKNGHTEPSNGTTPAHGHASPSTGSRHTGPANGHVASEKQINYIEQLAGKIHGLGSRRLDSLAQRMFDKSLGDLSTLEASNLIDALKEIKAGRIDLAAAVNGEPS